MPEVHAILSASSSKRWLNCTPSARLEQNFPNESSVHAEEGTAAHALGEYKLRKYLHERVKRPTSEYEDEEMEANTDIYAEFIISTVERIKETCPHPLVMVEERLDYSYLVPSGFGTGDCVIIADGTLYVMDYKNGKGVFVNCDHNPQMMLYALGAYHAYGYRQCCTQAVFHHGNGREADQPVKAKAGDMEDFIGTEVDILPVFPWHFIRVGVINIIEVPRLIPVYLRIFREQRIQPQYGVLPIPDDLRIGVAPQEQVGHHSLPEGKAGHFRVWFPVEDFIKWMIQRLFLRISIACISVQVQRQARHGLR